MIKYIIITWIPFRIVLICIPIAIWTIYKDNLVSFCILYYFLFCKNREFLIICLSYESSSPPHPIVIALMPQSEDDRNMSSIIIYKIFNNICNFMQLSIVPRRRTCVDYSITFFVEIVTNSTLSTCSI